MGYFEMLTSMVKDSKLTLKEIADRCAVHGVKITPAYISKLQTTKQAPASDEVSIAIAKVCGGDIEKFLYEGYIEKAPSFIRENIKVLINAHKELMLTNVKYSFPEISEEDLRRIQADIDNLSDFEVFQFEKTNKEKSPNLQAELYSMRKAGNEGEEEYQAYPIYGVLMDDDSMEPRIPKGASLFLISPENINKGDIVLVKNQDNEFIVRRYIPLEEQILLISENLSYEPLLIDRNRIEIVGKVRSIKINI